MTATAELIKSVILPQDIENARDTLVAALSLRVESVEDYKLAAWLLQHTNAEGVSDGIKPALKRNKAGLESILAPLRETSKAAKNFIQPTIDKWEQMLAHLTSEMTRFELVEKERAERHLTLVADGVSADTTALEVAVPKVDGMSSRVAYDVEIFDESKLPRDFLEPDMSAVRKAALAGQLTEAHGVKLIEKRIFTNRGK